MKFLFPSLGLLCLAVLSVARAQDEGQMAAPPDEIITDFGIEEYISVQKYTLSIGIRSLGGVKSSFSGRGLVSSAQPPGDLTTPGLARLYHDGNVLPDTNPYSFSITNADGSTDTYTAKPTPAGFTNTWTYLDARQQRDDGNIDFHSYTADISDGGLHQKNPDTGYGMEVTVARDMGKIGRKMEWKLLFGASLTDISSHTSDTLMANGTRTTDTYMPNLGDQTGLPTTLPYTAPSFKQVAQVDADGNPILDGTGSQVFKYVETTVYVTDHPIQRTVEQFQGVVSNRWDLKGAYFTFRLGPSLSYQFNSRLRLVVSAGAALVFAGTEYNVVQTFVPDISDPIVSTADSDEVKFLPGYFVDASLQFDVTERAGFYAGVTYQDTGSYSQTADLNDKFTGSTASYKALVDMSSLSGFRMGMTFRF